MQIKINQYDSVETGRYNGKYQIKLGKIGKEDKFYQAYMQVRKKDGTEINVPVCLTFEQDEDVANFIRSVAQEVGLPSSDVPF
ncbi:MAG: hypothetical protein PHE15_03675 [Dehalococcoidales bacterium]|jgi:hypothetical protein|uniref:hypothetical protein n=1 Tax=Candidatus Wunengus sp. YC60 TaxID=3367697 RepID=UPI004027F740|nr:hypothetical protein [Dehalococcoidales bacterium]